MAALKAVWIGLAVAALVTPAAAQTSLSIYGDGRVVVRRSLAQPLDKGRNTLSLKLDGVDAATLFSPDTAVALVSAVSRPATDRASALQSAVGQTLAFARGKGDTVRATVLRVAPPQYRLADGRVLLTEPGEPLFPGELVRAVPDVAVVLEATRARPRTELAYVTVGARWEATYQVLLAGAGRATITGAATVTSQGLRTDSAEVQLVAGSIARARPGQPTAETPRMDAMMVAAAVVTAGEEAVAETHVYLLPARLVLEPGSAVTVALFPRAAAGYTEELIVPGVLPWRGFLGPASGDPNRVPVQVWYTLKRARATPFGDRPLPAGSVELYQTDSSGRVQLIGEAHNDHTAPGRDLRVQAGDAFDVTAERVQTDFSQEQLPPPRRGLSARQRVTAAFKLTITNAKPAAVTVDVREARAGVWQIVESSLPAEKLSASEVRFHVPVPANGTATLTYTVQAES
ncbi:MAG TPA: hypothetical protein VH116_04060 [Gemmatimonadales bacterium]|jgi:hypothetical protein|nr:hypothetical protein [Gemmatimonadales bacterium]